MSASLLMGKGIKGSTFVFIYSLLFSIFGILTPRIFFRFFIPNNQLAELIGLVGIAVYLGLSVYVLSRLAIEKRLAVLITFLLLFSVFRYAWAGMDLRPLMQWSLSYLAVTPLFLMGRNPFSERVFQSSLIIAISLCFIVIADPTGLLERRIGQVSFQGVYFENIGAGASRSSAFAGAPGALSLLSAITAAFFLIRLIFTKKILCLLPFLMAVACGLSTYNRSFLGVFCVMPLLILFLSWRQLKLGVVFASIGLQTLIVIAGVFVWFNTDYGYRMSARLDSSSLEKAISMRTDEISGLKLNYQAVAANPFFGSAVYDPSREYIVINVDGLSLRPHNGFYQVWSSRGVVFGLVITLFYLIAAYRYGVAALLRKSRIVDHFMISCFASFIVAQAICLVESFWETNLVLLLGMFGLQALCIRKIAPIPFRRT